MKIRKRLGLASMALAMVVGSLVAMPPTTASAHGVAMFPGARTFLCWKDGLRANGEIIAYNPACAAAIAQSGVTPLYNWFAVLRSNANGQTSGFIPDGQICSGGTGGPYDFTGYNQARTDWPTTHLTSGSTIQVQYSNWARHPGTFHVYMTRAGWNPATPLAWSDLVSFWSSTNPPETGGAGALNYYYWDVTLPARTGRHIMYIQWVRSDSQENFFSCSDVMFDGGTGQVTGVGPNQTSQAPPSSAAPSSAGPTTAGPTTAGPTSAVPTSAVPTSAVPTTPSTGTGCSATAKVISSWNPGFQDDITVKNNGSAPLNGWTVRMTFANGQTVTQIWSGTATTSGNVVTVKNVEYNRTIPAGGTTTFGFLGTWSGTNALPTLTCTSP